MMFIPGLRSFGAVTLFTVFFALLLTLPTSRAQAFMLGLTKRVNDTIAEVTTPRATKCRSRNFSAWSKAARGGPSWSAGCPG